MVDTWVHEGVLDIVDRVATRDVTEDRRRSIPEIQHVARDRARREPPDERDGEWSVTGRLREDQRRIRRFGSQDDDITHSTGERRGVDAEKESDLSDPFGRQRRRGGCHPEGIARIWRERGRSGARRGFGPRARPTRRERGPEEDRRSSIELHGRCERRGAGVLQFDRDRSGRVLDEESAEGTDGETARHGRGDQIDGAAGRVIGGIRVARDRDGRAVGHACGRSSSRRHVDHDVWRGAVGRYGGASRTRHGLPGDGAGPTHTTRRRWREASRERIRDADRPGRREGAEVRDAKSDLGRCTDLDASRSTLEHREVDGVLHPQSCARGIRDRVAGGGHGRGKRHL